MAVLFSPLASAPLADLMAIAGLACIAIALFGWASGTIAASVNFRAFSGLLGTLLLFYVYGIYSPRAALEQGAQAGRTAPEQSNAQIAGAQPSQAPAPQPPQPPAQQAAQTQSTEQRSAQQPQSSQSNPQSTQQSPQPVPQQSPQAAPQGLFSGKWKNADPKSASILFLMVEEQGDAVTVRAWGMCASQYCDWGTGHGVVSGGAAQVTWEQGPVLRRMKLLPSAGTLRVVLDSTYRDRRPPQHTEAHFAKSL